MRTFWHGVLGFPIYHETPGSGTGGAGQSGATGHVTGATGADGHTGRSGATGADGQRGAGGSGQRGDPRGSHRRSSDGTQTTQSTQGGTRGTRLSDDFLVETEDGRVIPFRDYRGEIERTVDGTYQSRYSQAHKLLLEEAAKLDARRVSGGQQQQPQQPNDPFADIDDGTLIDGRTAKRIAQVLSQSGLKPIADLVTSMQREILGLKNTLKGTQTHIGQFNEDRSGQQFESSLSQSLSGIEVKGFPAKLDVNNEAVRDIGRDLYLSYTPESWRPGEYNKYLGDRLSGLFAYFTKALKDHADGASDRLRQHFDPSRGRTRPAGEAKPRFLTAREITQQARDMGMFGGGNNRT